MTRNAQYGPDGATATTGSTALIMGGKWYPSPPGSTNVTELYDGTSWSPVNSMNTPRYYAGGSGTSTAAMECAGIDYPSPGVIGFTELYDGTSWAEGGDVVNARGYGNASGGQSGTILASGGSPVQLFSEEYALPPAIKTFTAT